MKVAVIFLIIVIIVLLWPAAIFGASLIGKGQGEGYPGQTGSLGAGGPIGTVATTETLNGLTIPFPDTKLGNEDHLGSLTGPHYEGADSVPLQCENNDTPKSKNPLVCPAGGAYPPHTPDQERWYFNERWPSGKYRHLKVVITSVETGRSVVASIEEYGPAEFVTERDGIAAGAPPEVFVGLGIKRGVANNKNPTDNKSRVHVAFAQDQNTPLGPVTAGAGNPSGSLPADKGVCTFCTQKALPFDGPNFNHNYGVPKYIILHYLDSGEMTPQKAWDYFKGGDKHVQFVIGHDGTTYQFEPETHQPAGTCGFNNVEGGVSISIENEGHFEDGQPGHYATSAQLQSNIKLVKYLMQKYNIPKDKVISHGAAYQDAHKRGATYQDGKTPCEARSDPGDRFMNAVLAAL